MCEGRSLSRFGAVLRLTLKMTPKKKVPVQRPMDQSHSAFLLVRAAGVDPLRRSCFATGVLVRARALRICRKLDVTFISNMAWSSLARKYNSKFAFAIVQVLWHTFRNSSMLWVSSLGEGEGEVERWPFQLQGLLLRDHSCSTAAVSVHRHQQTRTKATSSP